MVWNGHRKACFSGRTPMRPKEGVGLRNGWDAFTRPAKNSKKLKSDLLIPMGLISKKARTEISKEL
jgi:hypothetical protein